MMRPMAAAMPTLETRLMVTKRPKETVLNLSVVKKSKVSNKKFYGELQVVLPIMMVRSCGIFPAIQRASANQVKLSVWVS